MPPPLPLPCSPLTPSPAVLPKRTESDSGPVLLVLIPLVLFIPFVLRHFKGTMAGRVKPAARKSTGGKAPNLATKPSCKSALPTEESLKDNAFKITKHTDSLDKSEDKQALMKGMVQDLFRRETSWWSTLTDEDKSKMCPGWEPCLCDDPPDLCISGQVALVLAGINPCAFVSTATACEFGQLLYEHVLRPWYDKHLSESGSVLDGFVCEPTNPTVTVVHNGQEVNVGCGALFLNLNHPEAPDSDLVKTVFTRNHPIDTQELRSYCGCPGRLPDHKNAVDVTYRYQNHGKDICDYGAKNVDAAAVGKHFRKG